MALFGFGDKQRAPPEPLSAPGSPMDLVLALKQQNMSNDQIISELERQGYNSSQIFDALNKANISGPAPYQQPNMNMPPPQSDFPQEAPFMPQEQQFDQPPPPAQVDEDKIEEIAEAIIDEKWKEFEDDVKVILDWKEQTEIKIDKIEQQVNDLTQSLNTLHQSILGKISQYDRNITDVGVEIKAMEKVFQKVLPNLTENVNKLERMTKSSKSK